MTFMDSVWQDMKYDPEEDIQDQEENFGFSIIEQYELAY